MFRLIAFVLALSLFTTYGFDASLVVSAMEDSVIVVPTGKQDAAPSRNIEANDDSVIVVPTGSPTP